MLREGSSAGNFQMKRNPIARDLLTPKYRQRVKPKRLRDVYDDPCDPYQNDEIRIETREDVAFARELKIIR